MIVSVGEKVMNIVALTVFFQLVHESSAVPTHLVRRRDCAKGNLCKVLRRVTTVGDPADDDSIIHAHYGGVVSIEHEPDDVLSWHFGQLL